MKEFLCIKKCTHNGRLWTPGEVLTAKEAPHHFNETKNADKGAEIRRALLALDRKDDTLWTVGGEPKMQFVIETLGFKVTRKELEAAFPDFNRETVAFSQMDDVEFPVEK